MGSGLLAVIPAGYIVLPTLLPHAIIFAPNAIARIAPEDDPDSSDLLSQGASSHLRIPVGPPEASIACLVVEPPGRPVGTILILHGIWGRKEVELEKGRAWAERGYRVALIDLRGHGRSTGACLTFGVVESADIVQVISFLEKKGLLRQPLGVIGYSYGGAVALQAAARDRRVAAVASISTFASMRRVVGAYVSARLPVIGSWVTSQQLDNATMEAGRLAGFNPSDANTAAAVARITVPIFLAHGQEDRNIPVDDVRELARAAGARATLLIVDGADHDAMMRHEHEPLESALRTWILDRLQEGRVSP